MFYTLGIIVTFIVTTALTAKFIGFADDAENRIIALILIVPFSIFWMISVPIAIVTAVVWYSYNFLIEFVEKTNKKK